VLNYISDLTGTIVSKYRERRRNIVRHPVYNTRLQYNYSYISAVHVRRSVRCIFIYLYTYFFLHILTQLLLYYCYYHYVGVRKSERTRTVNRQMRYINHEIYVHNIILCTSNVFFNLYTIRSCRFRSNRL